MEVIGENLRHILDDIGNEVVDHLRQSLQDKGKDATGALSSSIGYTITEGPSGLTLNITSLDYLKNVNDGRKPGKMPPPSKIVPWVKARGIKMTSKSGGIVSTDSMAFIIARSIGEKGIKPTNVLSETQQWIVDNKLPQIADSVTKDINDMVKNLFNNI